MLPRSAAAFGEDRSCRTKSEYPLLFASFCHLLDCKLVMFIDIILRQLVILLGMSYNFWTVFFALGFLARVVY